MTQQEGAGPPGRGGTALSCSLAQARGHPQTRGACSIHGLHCSLETAQGSLEGTPWLASSAVCLLPYFCSQGQTQMEHSQGPTLKDTGNLREPDGGGRVQPVCTT